MNNKHFARMTAVLFGFAFLVASGRPLAWAQVKLPPASTVAKAKEVLDLTEIPLMDGAKTPERRTYSKLTYQVPGVAIKETFEFHRQQLLKDGWTAVDGFNTRWTFKKEGYTVTLATSIFNGHVGVNIDNHGNADLAKLPMPVGAKQFSVGGDSARFHVSTTVVATNKALLKSLPSKGWQPYGEGEDVLYFKQNAVRLTINAYPADKKVQGTLIDITPELLLHDLPALPDATELKYEDSTGLLAFNTKSKSEPVATFYVKELTKKGWKAGSKTLTKSASGDTMKFENPADDPLTLMVTANGAITHVELKQEAPKAAN